MSDNLNPITTELGQKTFHIYEDFYRELYEAVYFFYRIYSGVYDKLPLQLNYDKKMGLSETIYNAIIRILVVNNMIDYDKNSYVFTNENMMKHKHILENNIFKPGQVKHYEEMYNKALNELHFFFDSISDLEYEIYSRCNFHVTYEFGKKAVKHLDLRNKKILELGGNSGGLGTAILAKNSGCAYTVVDTEIPCMIGNEFKELYETNITFIEGNVFELMLSDNIYDYIIIMNLLHDFDDEKCLKILNNSSRYCNASTKFIVIEDIRHSEFEPHEVIMHGLRLSVECSGGRQRTINEIERLFINVNYKLEKVVKIDNIFTMLVLGA